MTDRGSHPSSCIAKCVSPPRRSWPVKVIVFALFATSFLPCSYGFYLISSHRAGAESVGLDQIEVTPGQPVGVVESGTVVTASFTVKNKSDRPIRILGADTSCSCTTVDELPPLLEASQSLVIKLSIHTPETPTPFHGQCDLFTDNSNQRTVALKYDGKAVKTSEETVK